MCKGMEEYTLRTKVLSIIDYLKIKNIPIDEIITEVIKLSMYRKNMSSFSWRLNRHKGEMDMCKGMEEYTLKVSIESAIKAYRVIKMSDKDIVKIIVDNFQVNTEYVKSLMGTKPA